MLKNTWQYTYFFFNNCVAEVALGHKDIRIGKSKYEIVRDNYAEIDWDELQTLLSNRPDIGDVNVNSRP